MPEQNETPAPKANGRMYASVAVTGLGVVTAVSSLRRAFRGEKPLRECIGDIVTASAGVLLSHFGLRELYRDGHISQPLEKMLGNWLAPAAIIGA